MAAQANDDLVAMVEPAAGDGALYACEPGYRDGAGSPGPEIGTVEGQTEPIGIRIAIDAKIIGPTLSLSEKSAKCFVTWYKLKNSEPLGLACWDHNATMRNLPDQKVGWGLPHSESTIILALAKGISVPSRQAPPDPLTHAVNGMGHPAQAMPGKPL